MMPHGTGKDELQRYLLDSRRLIEDALDRQVPPLGTAPAVLHEAMRYALLAPGERIRGVLVLASAELFRGAREPALPLACVVELIHRGIMILDDLPVMDNASTRRGRPVLHEALGEANAILAAMGLLNAGFELIQQAAGIRDRTRSTLSRCATDAVGAAGLIGGRVMDTDSADRGLDTEALLTIHRRKTAPLFVLAVELGGVSAGTRTRDLEALRRYAEHLGLAFQITDDLLDYSGKPETSGRETGPGRDRTTGIDLWGIDGARRLVDEQIDRALAALSPFPRRGATLTALAEHVRSRDR
jgi:geranylgeranyl diphosphate synthase type II